MAATVVAGALAFVILMRLVIEGFKWLESDAQEHAHRYRLQQIENERIEAEAKRKTPQPCLSR